MKKTLIALATLAAAGTAFAQSTATISGGINVGVMDTGAAGAKAGVAHLGNGANAINIGVREDLGGGLRGGFESQIRFNAQNGDVNSTGAGNALFHSINTFVSGGFGTARIGKIVEASTCGMDPWACTGGASLQAGVGLSALTGAAAVSNAVSYTTPALKGALTGLSASYQTSMTGPDQRINERETLSINYAKGPLALTFVDIKGSGNTAGNNPLGGPIELSNTASTATQVRIGDTATKNQGIGASYNFGFARLSVVNSVSKSAAGVTTADITSIGATVPMGAYTILAGYNKAKTGTGYTATAANDTKLAVGVNYALSKRTTLGADLFKAEGLAAVNGATGTSGNGFVVRARHTF
jgi:predicted porin